MITELYELDQELTEYSLGNEVTFEILEKSGDTWQTALTLSPTQIVSESLEIEQSICDKDELVIGGCIPSKLQLSVMNVSQNLLGKRIVVKVSSKYSCSYYPSSGGGLVPKTTLYPSETLYPSFADDQTGQYVLFVGQIVSYKRSDNKAFYKIVAFDRMYYASTFYCKEATYNYINGLFWDRPPEAGDPQTMHLNNLIHLLFKKGKISNPGFSDYINYLIAFDIEPSCFDKEIDKEFTPLQGIKWICELNGIFLIEDMPENLSADKATPRNVILYRNQNLRYSINTYSHLDYEDYIVKGIHEVTFCAHGYEKNEFATIRMNPTKGFSIYNSDNGLTRSMRTASNSSSSPTAERSIYTAVTNLRAHGSAGSASPVNEPNRILGDIYSYRPFKASIFNRWWVQVGDRIRIPTNDSRVPNVDGIVFSRKIKGINAMMVTIEAKGLEVQGKENDTSSE